MLDDENTELDPNDESTDLNIDDPTMVVESVPEQEDTLVRNASLIVLAGGEIGRTYRLSEKESVFGRSLLASHWITSRSVSREHAKVVRVHEPDQEYFELIDLESRNGTRVNNARVERARLKNGDKVQMGEVLFKFVLQDEADSQFHQDVHRLIHYDQLTGLLTMEAFRRRLDTEMRKTGAFLTLAMTDLDGLKRVNDTHGHLAGRMVVREMGTLIREAIRSQDFAGLYGGDEAIILFPATHLEQALPVAEGLRQAIEARTFEHEGRTFNVTISQGLAEWPKQARTPEQVIAAADAALYAAKEGGRNCVRLAGSDTRGRPH